MIEKDEGIIAAVQLKIKLFDFLFYQSKQLTDYIHTDIYCKLSKCIGQTPCSYEHYLVNELCLINVIVVCRARVIPVWVSLFRQVKHLGDM